MPYEICFQLVKQWVDFHWEVDGKEFTYHMAGGGSINLKELLPALNVVWDIPETDINEVDIFFNQIKDVTFSDEGLLKVVHPEHDITLKDLKEALGIAYDDSKSYAVGSVRRDEENGKEDRRYSFNPENADGLTFSAPEAEGAAAETGPEEGTEATELAEIAENEVIPAGSWVLISLKPFLSDELLTIKMENEDSFVIKVTDEQQDAWDVWFDGTLGQSGGTNYIYSGAENKHISVTKGQPTTLPTKEEFRHPTGYDYTLKGWYLVNPQNNETQYFEPGASVTVTHDCVFYADWVPTSYSKGPANGKALVGDTPSTAGFVTTEMFDYNELLNAYLLGGKANSTSVDQNGHKENWTSSGQFVFISWNFRNNPNLNTIGYPDNDWSSSVLGDKSSYRGDTLTTGIFTDDLKETLFGQSEVLGKTYVGTGDRLFRYDNVTGDYYYDSDKNAATYNQADRRFYVYQDKELIASNEGVGMTNFLPYNDYPGGGVHAQNTGATNYWFGMKNTINFYLPDDVRTVGGNKTEKDSNKNMQFRFSGDDDVWVFVDDKLVLDLGGIHNRTGGIIDFSTGTVTKFVGTLGNQNNPTVDEAASNRLKEIEEGTHTLTVYYLERGSSLSNCSIYFNLQPKPKYLDLSKRLVGLTDEERKKYTDEEFTFELIVNDTPYTSSEKAYSEDTKKAKEYQAQWFKKGATEPYKTGIITNGQITIKDGETVRIPHLERFDTFYVAEQQGTNMDQFEIPHAERIYHEDGTTIQHEEELNLKEGHSHAEGQTQIVDWETYKYKLNDTEKVTFTNTLRERDLEIEKVWKNVPTAKQVPVTFTVKATIPGETANSDPVEVSVNEISGKTFKLEAPTWQQVIEKLPATTNGGKPITYTIIEDDNGFVSTVTTTDKNLCDVDVVKYWPDEKHAYWAADPNHEPEVIQFKLKNGAGKYYNQDASERAGKAIFDDTGTWFELNEINGYTQRIHDVPVNDDYSYYEPDGIDENPNTSGLSIFKRPVSVTVIENTPKEKGKLTVSKVWKNAQGTVMEEPPAGTTMTYQIYRVKHVHDWSEWKQTKAPTEKEKGEEQRKCLHAGCNETQTRELEVIGHNWVHDSSKDKAVTCTEDGYEYWYCTNCGASEHRNIMIHAGHQWDDGVIDPKPTTEREGKITYKCTVCGATETKPLPKVTNVFPGTDIPLQEDAIPKGEHDDNEEISVNQSGIFEYKGNYYIITKGGPVSNWAGIKANVTQGLINHGMAIQLDPNGTKYTPETFKSLPGYDARGKKRDSMQIGDLYHADDGTWYVFTMATSGKEPSVDMNNWYKIPGTGPATSGDGTGVNGANSALRANASRKQMNARRAASGLTVTSAINEKIEELRARKGYTTAGGEEKYYYTVELLDQEDFSLPYENKWTRTHDVDLEDEEGNPYTYYVVETSPTTGWITSYEGEPAEGFSDEALKGDGKAVIITNQQDQTPVSVDVFKVDAEKASGTDGRFLAGAKFSLGDEKGHAIAPSETIKIINKKTEAEIKPDRDNQFEIPAEGVTITGLTDGTYTLTEHAAPAGYVIIKNTTTFTVSNGMVSGWSLTGDPGTKLEIPNPPGAALPNTGGSGTRVFTILGSIMMLAAGVLLWRRQRLI